jgi:AraC family transcriptional regulator of adaptative response / DNA-3-methyladenine glycosylase II
MTVGMPRKRAETLWRLGVLVQNGELDLEEMNPQLFYERLVAQPGIGPWTAQYLMMRALHWPDALPAGDLGLQKALSPPHKVTEKEVIQQLESVRPWRSYATILLWKSLENKGG